MATHDLNRQWMIGRGEGLFILVVAFALTLTLAARTAPLTAGHPDFAKPWDHHKYIRMAEAGVLNFHIAPFCRRVGLPLLARCSPFTPATGFRLFTFLAVVMTGVGIYGLCRAFGFARQSALGGLVIFYALGWAARYPLHNFWLPDALSFLFITLAIWAAAARQDLLLALALAAGALVKETVIFVAPLAYTLHASKIADLRLAGRTALLALPAILILVLLRVAIPVLNEDPQYLATLPEALWRAYGNSSDCDLARLLREVGMKRLHNLSAADLGALTLGPFGVLALPALFAPRRSLARFVRFAPFIVLVYAQLLLATNTERLLAAAFPAVIVLAVGGIEAAARRLRIRPIFFSFLPLALIGLAILHRDTIVVSMRLQALVFALVLGGLWLGGKYHKGSREVSFMQPSPVEKKSRHRARVQ